MNAVACENSYCTVTVTLFVNAMACTCIQLLYCDSHPVCECNGLYIQLLYRDSHPVRECNGLYIQLLYGDSHPVCECNGLRIQLMYCDNHPLFVNAMACENS